MTPFNYPKIWKNIISKNNFGVGPVLKAILAAKQEKSKISLRSFSKKLDISPSMMTQVLNEKRNLSLPQIKKICEILQFSESEEKLFSLMWKYSKAVDEKDQKSLTTKIKGFYLLCTENKIPKKQYSIMKNWRDLAVSDAIRTSKSGRSVKEISKILSMAPNVVLSSLQELQLRGMVKKDSHGLYQNEETKQILQSKSVSDDFYAYFKQYQALSGAYLDQRKSDTEYVGCLTVPLNPEDVDEAKEWIHDLMIKLRLLSEKREESTHVHAFLFHLFPLGDYPTT